jgi:hypothetical protein
MFNLYDRLVMDAAGTGSKPEAGKNLKHLGVLKKDNAQVAILFRTVPGDSNSCLVIGPKFLPDIYRESFMRALESKEGQESFELGTHLAKLTFPDGPNMLALLHIEYYLKKMPTSDIIVTYGAGDAGKISLDKLNQMIADDLKVSVNDLAVKEDIVISKKPKPNKKSNGKETAKN